MHSRQCKCKTIIMFVDATFFLAPDGFYQLLTFHGVLSNGKTFVADFVLIKSKR